MTPTCASVDVPRDIWLEIIEWIHLSPFHGRNTIHTLSLTNRQLRDITVPILYHSLSFENKSSYGPFHIALVQLIRTYCRARSLYRAPHLLKHVREFSLNHWIWYGGMDADTQTHGGGSPGTSVSDLVPAILDSLVSLFSRMPRLHHVKLWNCSMPPRLYDSLFSDPRIDTLSLANRISYDIRNVPTAGIKWQHIRHMMYSTPRRYSVDAFFPGILEQCSPDLQSLDIQAAKLPYVIIWAADRVLSLKTLKVNFRPREDGVIPDMWNLLRICPKLRALEIVSRFTAQEWPPLTSDVAPNLETISVPPGLAQSFTVGRAVKRITIDGRNDIPARSVMEIVGYSTAHLRELSLCLSLGSYQELIEFLQSLHVYSKLSILQITLLHRNDEYALMDMMTLEEREAFGNALRQLPRLRICSINGVARLFPRTGLRCPIASEGDPRDRGHESLEEVQAQCLDDGRWVWFHNQGWTCMPDL